MKYLYLTGFAIGLLMGIMAGNPAEAFSAGLLTAASTICFATEVGGGPRNR